MVKPKKSKLKTPVRRSTHSDGLPPHVRIIVSKGREYFYFHPFHRRGAKRERLPATPADQEFWDAYDRLIAEHGLDNETLQTTRVRPKSFRALVLEYRQSQRFLSRAAKTRQDYARYLDWIDNEYGDLDVKDFTTAHVMEMQEQLADKPATANYRKRVLSLLLSYGKLKGYCSDNVAKGVPTLAIGEYEPWPWVAVEYAKKHMSPHLWWAVALAVYTGQRQSDCLRMQWSAVDEGAIAVTPNFEALTNAPDMSESDALALMYSELGMTPEGQDFEQQKTGKKLWIKVHDDLREILGQIPRRATTILTNSRGQPWQSGFRASWQKEMRRQEMRPLSVLKLQFHGLRKLATIKLLEAGCTDAQVRAVTGHSAQMLEHYAKRVNQKKLAASAMKRWKTTG